MNEQNERSELRLSDFYNGKSVAGHVDRIKFLLMPFVFFALLGVPISGIAGNYINTISSFSGLAFFVFCGFFVLAPDPEKRMRKLTRALKRSWLFFAILFVLYLAINIAYLAYIGNLKALTDPEFLRKRTFFEFFVLNVWPLPVGKSIWFIQSLAYAYLFLFLAEKLKLSKIYLPLLIVLWIFLLASGEFAGIVRISYFGYPYIPGGFLTKALPFMLFGMFLRKYIDRLARIPRFVYAITFFAGIVLSVGELFLLSKLGKLVYSGNMIGYAVIAISVCCFAVTEPDIGNSFLGSHGGSYARRMYAAAQPVSLLVWMFCNEFYPDGLQTVNQFGSVICFVICFAIAVLIGFFRFKIAVRNGDLNIEEK